ncbi:MAG TPA: PadR family transcriptional regulator [Spirochaetia bacterium]|nr:PadR family transcriptional regulator [Spirochaetia bacterium]
MIEQADPGGELGRAVDKWRSQSRKGFLELCILACVRGAGRSYGFAMLERLSSAGLEVGEGSMYPLLTRLVREGMLEASWETPAEGHPRKYYRLSPLGSAFLERVVPERERDQRAFEAILSGACSSGDERGGEDKVDEDRDDSAARGGAEPA